MSVGVSSVCTAIARTTDRPRNDSSMIRYTGRVLSCLFEHVAQREAPPPTNISTKFNRDGEGTAHRLTAIAAVASSVLRYRGRASSKHLWGSCRPNAGILRVRRN